MNINSMYELNILKNEYFYWRNSLSIQNKLLLSFLMSCLTGLLAQTKFYLPWTPVPVTGQTFAVFFSIFMLGSIWAGISQTIYLSIGLIGVPWFAGGKGGLIILISPTIGYLVGFIVAAFVLGYIVDKSEKIKKGWFLIIAIVLTNFLIIHALGLIGLAWSIYLSTGEYMSFNYLMYIGFYPFIIGDIVKIFLIIGIGKTILPTKKIIMAIEQNKEI